MKLNIGCGNTYKPTYTNIDLFNTSVADKQMPAQNLDFPDNSIDEILAKQLIEHLGYFTTIHALSEWFRVLKPNAKLHLETPDLEQSFKSYLKGKRETKKNILSWIYGLDSTGMYHHFCFSKELLTEILTKIGFNNIKISCTTNKEKQPILKATCRKTRQYQCFQITATFRKKLHKAEIIPSSNHICLLEQEKLIDFFSKKINQIKKSENTRLLDELTINGCIQNPSITKILLEECLNYKLLQKHKITPHIKTADYLESKEFPYVLISILKKTPKNPGTQKEAFETTYTIGKQYAKKVLSSIKKSETIPELTIIKVDCKKDMPCFYSAELIEQEAGRLAYQAIKQFSLKHHNEAIKKFQEAIKLERNRLLYYWNLGRLLKIIGKKETAINYYDQALTLVKLSHQKGRKKLEKIIQEEMTNQSMQPYSQPITEVVL